MSSSLTKLTLVNSTIYPDSFRREAFPHLTQLALSGCSVAAGVGVTILTRRNAAISDDLENLAGQLKDIQTDGGSLPLVLGALESCSCLATLAIRFPEVDREMSWIPRL